MKITTLLTTAAIGFILSACSSETAETTAPLEAVSSAVAEVSQVVEQQPAEAANNTAPDASPRGENIRFYSTFKPGDALPQTLKLFKVSGEEVAATELLTKPYTVFISGCLTCGQFRISYPEVEAVYNDYKDQNIDFYFIYQTLQHPENDSYVQAFNMQERFLQVEAAKKDYGTSVPWVLDTFDNNWKSYFQKHPNSEIIVDQNGKMIHAQPWVRHPNLRNAMEKLFGKVETPTTVADLNLPEVERISVGNVTDVLARVRLPGVSVPLEMTPGESDETYYAKLRPEAGQELITSGSGQMYMGFHLDPIYNVYWNNLAEPVTYKLSLPDGVTATPIEGVGPVPAVEADKNPREFILDIQNWTEASGKIGVEMYYFACNKEQGFCKPVKQTYQISNVKDELAGSAHTRRRAVTDAGT